MGVYMTSYQMKQEFFEEFTELMKEVESKRGKVDYSELQKIYDRMDKILENDSISKVDYKSIITNNIQMLITRDKESPYKYDENDIGQLPFYGNNKYGFCLTEGSEGILQINDIKKIVKYLDCLKIYSKEEFDTYYGKLPDGLKYELYIEPLENETEEEDLYRDLKPFLDFYLDCKKNKSWIYLHCS